MKFLRYFSVYSFTYRKSQTVPVLPPPDVHASQPLQGPCLYMAFQNWNETDEIKLLSWIWYIYFSLLNLRKLGNGSAKPCVLYSSLSSRQFGLTLFSPVGFGNPIFNHQPFLIETQNMSCSAWAKLMSYWVWLN
jgi:hypothetical protein